MTSRKTAFIAVCHHSTNEDIKKRAEGATYNFLT